MQRVFAQVVERQADNLCVSDPIPGGPAKNGECLSLVKRLGCKSAPKGYIGLYPTSPTNLKTTRFLSSPKKHKQHK